MQIQSGKIQFYDYTSPRTLSRNAGAPLKLLL